MTTNNKKALAKIIGGLLLFTVCAGTALYFRIFVPINWGNVNNGDIFWVRDYNGHRYIMHKIADSESVQMVHDPDCVCRKSVMGSYNMNPIIE